MNVPTWAKPKHRFNVFPEMQGDDYARLKEDLAANGFDSKQPIWVYQGGVIDGWNRQRACIEIGTVPAYKEFIGTDIEAISFVMRTNKRRNLTSSQWACIAVEAEEVVTAIKAEVERNKLEKQKENAANRHTLLASDNKLQEANNVVLSNDIVAQTFNTNRSYISQADNLKQSDPEAFKEVKSGKKTFTQLAKERKQRAKQTKKETYQKKVAEIAAKLEAAPDELMAFDTPIARAGQWVELGPHRLYCGDNRDEAFLSALPKCALAFADPPYNAGVDQWDEGFVWAQDYLADLADFVLVTPGVVSIKSFLEKTAMPYRWSLFCWLNNGMTRGGLGFGNVIYAAIFSRLESIHRNMGDFFQISIKVSETQDTDHRGRKPYGYMAYIIDNFTAKGDTIIDPFLGSGTTLLVSDQMGRTCYAAEKDLSYCQQIIERYYEVTNP